MISTVTYNGDGVTRIFPVAFEIKGEEYTVVYVGGVAVADRSLYDIINNAIVFNTAPVIGTNNVEIVVASTTTEIADLNAPPSTIQTVLDNMAGINAIVNTVIPNINEILLADDNATTATTKALEALTSANNADTSEANALTYSNNALTSANNADISEANALSYKNSAEVSATTATTQAGIATTKAGEAGVSASNALASEEQAGIYASQLGPTKIVAKDSPTGSAMMPAGTTAERTALPSNGNLRYNNDLSKFEGYQGGVWSTLGGLDINTLTAKATPIDADEMVLADSTSSFSLKKFTLSNLKTVLDLTWTANDTRAKTALNASGTAPIYACRAWVNFNGTGTVAIRASGNVSSITDNGTGDYTVNFITAMPDINYAAISSGQRDNAGAANSDIITGSHRSATSHTTTSYRTSTVGTNGIVIDPITYELVIFI